MTMSLILIDVMQSVYACACVFVFPCGQLQCWGRNQYGQLGLGDNNTRGGTSDADEMGDNLPFVDVGTDETVESVALGSSHTCAVLTSGSLKVGGWVGGSAWVVKGLHTFPRV